MVQQITKGIKISVDTRYDGTMERNHMSYHVFSYFITIENTSNETVQLKERFWIIFDSLNNTEIVEGEGVVGQTPILKPNEHYTYKSGCVLESNIGAMKGYFKMIHLENSNPFKVIIPTFQLTTSSLLN